MYYFNSSILTILLLIAISASISVPSVPPGILNTNIDPNDPNDPVAPICFQPGQGDVYPISMEICTAVQDFIISRDGPAEYLKQQRFVQGFATRPDDHQVPDHWRYEYGAESCEIKLTSGPGTPPDTFSLLNVSLMANRIIRTCPGESKASLGGLAIIGRKGFFVVVNGKSPGVVSEEWSNSNGLVDLYEPRVDATQVD